MTDAVAQVKPGRKIPAIWLVPIVAVVLGIYMVVYNFMTEGPEITIEFPNAEGIEAGKTKIKSLNVELGVVQGVELTEDMNAVRVTAKLERFAIPLLKEDTQFWVVRPRVGPGGVSGLGTILSGGYIQLSDGVGEAGRREFTGLDRPPVTPAGTPGLKLQLISTGVGDVSAGDPIVYRGFPVGQVEKREFDPSTSEIRYDVFIKEPYKELVTANTRFWNASGISLTASAQGLELDVGSLQSVLQGGVAFDLPEGKEAGAPAGNGDVYALLPSRDDVNKKVYEHYLDVVVAFEQSVSGLTPGAPVEYRGIQIGTVQRLMIAELMGQDISQRGDTDQTYGEPIPVLVRIEPGRLGLPDSQEVVDLFRTDIEAGVGYGLRATLKTGNLLTGQLLIAFNYFPNAEPAKVTEFYGYQQLPTLSGGIARIEQQVVDLLNKLNDLPVEQVVDDIDELIVELNATLDSVSPDSQTGEQLNRSLSELNRTLRSIEELSRKLSDKPNAIIFSPPVEEDPVPGIGTEE